MKTENRRCAVHVHATILLPVRAGVHRFARATAKPADLGLPTNGAEQPGGDKAGVNHEAISLPCTYQIN
jgi:hypothetical protein